mmetsp:Transcript_2378/g.5136  ORF Transcript_2378/g.5136 Transcript_2378/m.5136 type:complete len:251 (+) Transcript_2378:66-818(+)
MKAFASYIPVTTAVLVAFGAMILTPSHPNAVAAFETKVKVVLEDDMGASNVIGSGLASPVKNIVKEDSSFFDRKGECEGCVTDFECQSNICSKLQCIGEDGMVGHSCRCVADDDCRSGYCNWRFSCIEKLKIGETGCTENDDCEFGYCGPKLDLDGVTECKPKLDRGSICVTDGQCRSGDCAWMDQKCPRCCIGTPLPTSSPTPPSSPQGNGSVCLLGHQCGSGKCGWKILGLRVIVLMEMSYWALEFLA